MYQKILIQRNEKKRYRSEIKKNNNESKSFQEQNENKRNTIYKRIKVNHVNFSIVIAYG